MTTTVFHGTQTTYSGTPTEQTDVYGLTGIFFTEDADDAETFADGSTQGSMDGDLRVFAAEIDLTGAYDLAAEADDECLEHEDIIERALASSADIIILPDMSGVSEREILVTWPSVINWQ
jgi:hypothetical protein